MFLWWKTFQIEIVLLVKQNRIFKVKFSINWQCIKCVQIIEIWTKIKSIFPVFNKKLISLKTNGKWPPHLVFWLWGYLKDKVYIFPMKSTDELKRKVIDNIRQIILYTFPVVTENFCQECIWCLDGKTVIWAFSINCDVTRRHSKIGMLRKYSAIVEILH